MRGRSNMRGALGALLVAGAAYAWKNRDRLTQQFNSLRGTQSNPNTTPPRSLPDLSGAEQRDFSAPSNSTFNERELGGTQM